MESRRIRCDLIETYKIINNVYSVPTSKRDIFECDNSGRRGHEYKLFKKRFRLDVRKFTFSNRVIDNWNSLPALCVNSATINSFKKHVSIALEPETV